MLLRQSTRRVIGVVLLISMSVFLGLTAAFTPALDLWRGLGSARWLVVALIAIVLISNGYRYFWNRPTGTPPAAKPRPSHLKLVRNDETLH